MRELSFLYLNQDDIFSLDISFDEIIAVTEKTLIEHAQREFEMPPKPGIHPLPGTFIHAMPSFLPKLRIAGLKWISGFPENMKKGLPTITGLLVLNDPETGVPLCVMDATWLTAVRTAVVSGIAAKHLLREGSSVLGIVGAGTQGRYHIEVIKHICPSFQEVHVFDISLVQLDKFRNHIQQSSDLKVKFSPNPETVFAESDLVITATGKQDSSVVERAWLKQGGFYIGVESFRYWSEEALLSADKFITDDWKQAQTFLENTKHIRATLKLYGELSEIINNAKPGRETKDERIVCIFVGMSLVDIVFGDLIYKRALENTTGKELLLGRF